MNKTIWNAAPDGRYWLDIAVGSHASVLMIDVGIVDPKEEVGCEVEPVIYDFLLLTGQLGPNCPRSKRDASGRTTTTESALTTMQLLDPQNRHGIGPSVQLYVCRGVAGVPSRVGVVFFHRLAGCRVLWELDQRQWCIEYT
jgi:hypothetical protein